MSSEQFQAAHNSIQKAGTHLLEYLQEIRQSRLSEGDETKGLQSVEDDIHKALSALKEQKYQVAVIAAMKAGKSTFLNAIIGADVLASETAACTICRTDVLHIPDWQMPRLLEYRDGQRQPIEIAKGNAGEIQQKFLVRTREIREKGNLDNTTRFEIEHPIEAISTLSSLAGFTLVDTPGPNEWESGNFNIALKQTALEALRTCNAILFVLNYASYKDNAISDLFKDVLENRKEILTEENTGKIYFILNKVDQKAEKDKEIADVIEDLKKELASFGFPNPIIYPASSRQGLLAKLIAQNEATESQIKDFKKFFSAKYAIEDEEGNQIIPAPRKIATQALKVGVRVGESLLNSLTKSVPEYFNSYDSAQSDQPKNYDPYKIRAKSKEDAEKIKLTINQFCAPHIQSLWLDTQDRLVRDGTIIRDKLASKIQDDIQVISNELSDYLGKTLQVELNINTIQFPKFEFEKIDQQIKTQQEAYKRKETKTHCCSSETYEDDAKEYSFRDVYNIDLRETVQLIKQKIDDQVLRNQHLLERVIEKQVSADFRNAQQQIDDYIKKFQHEFDRLLRERETREAENEQIRAMLESQKAQLNEYLRELTSIRASLNNWKPVQKVK
jgi:GTPase Era involved in 16S rRNA processing